MSPATEVAVYSEDGRSSDLATFHGWDKRKDGWYGHVMVYGPRNPGSGSGMYRDTVRADRIVPLVYCGRYPFGEIAHSCGQSHDARVWDPASDPGQVMDTDAGL